jgi:hypothetical protein
MTNEISGATIKHVQIRSPTPADWSDRFRRSSSDVPEGQPLTQPFFGQGSVGHVTDLDNTARGRQWMRDFEKE